ELRAADVAAHLRQMLATRPGSGQATLDRIGRSGRGRDIHAVTMGQGATRVLMWSQMHGNEPTHTAVLLDLIEFLTRQPVHPAAEQIRAGCTLRIIPLLNPDGAERWSRFNSQDLDVNRDALALQTPEGRLLRDVVLDFQPDFAFNLHNQNARTAIGDRLLPAAVSLLVPPADASLRETESMREAKLVAATFRAAVASHVGEMISRYPAGYMPTCFGEWVQSTGARTVLVEAGGSPGDDVRFLTQLHWFGLTSTVLAIANGSFRHTSPLEYESLPRAAESALFDRMIRQATVRTPGRPDFVADVGIDFVRGAMPGRDPGRGRIVDLGDLHTTRGQVTVGADGRFCVPGRMAEAADLTPLSLSSFDRWTDYLVAGATTLLGRVDLTDAEQLAAVRRRNPRELYPLNVAFVARMPTDQSIDPRWLEIVTQGTMAIDWGSHRSTHWSRVYGPRGMIRRGATADLLLLHPHPKKGHHRPDVTMLSGHIIADEGEFRGPYRGRWLTARAIS
ncbi:MAG TPA: M14 family zinc carboxypeptidase, partial [Pirellulaceae bacterium]